MLIGRGLRILSRKHCSSPKKTVLLHRETLSCLLLDGEPKLKSCSKLGPRLFSVPSLQKHCWD